MEAYEKIGFTTTGFVSSRGDPLGEAEYHACCILERPVKRKPAHELRGKNLGVDDDLKMISEDPERGKNVAKYTGYDDIA